MKARFLRKATSMVMAGFLGLILILPTVSYAGVVEEDPSAMAMTADMFIARPALLVATVLGSAVYLVSLPFSLAGGNSQEARNTLVVQPAKATFVRCLGCTRTGQRQSVE